MSRRKELTEAEAFQAMIAFLEGYWARGKSDEIAALLGSLTIQPDRGPADPAFAKDWSAAVRSVIARRDSGTKNAA